MNSERYIAMSLRKSTRVRSVNRRLQHDFVVEQKCARQAVKAVPGGIPGGISSRRLLSHPTSRGGSNLMVADCRARKTLSAFWSSMVLL